MSNAFRPVTLEIPRWTHTKKEAKAPNPFFKVLDVPLKRDFSVFSENELPNRALFTEETGDRHLVNAETGETVGSVSKSYKVVTHKDARDIVLDFIDKLGIEYKTHDPQISNKGARYFQTITFPGLAFNPAKDIASTALDNPGVHKDDFYPAFTWLNSYDKTSQVAFKDGLWRVWCENGSARPEGGLTTVSFRHTQIVDADRVRRNLVDRLEGSTRFGQKLFSQLNSQGGTQYLQNVLNGPFTDRFKRMVIENLSVNAQIDLSITTDELGRATEWVVQNATTKESAYAIWNVVTEISTHQITNRYDREVLDRKIAKVFAPAD